MKYLFYNLVREALGASVPSLNGTDSNSHVFVEEVQYQLVSPLILLLDLLLLQVTASCHPTVHLGACQFDLVERCINKLSLPGQGTIRQY